MLRERLSEIAAYCRVEADDAELPGFVDAAAAYLAVTWWYIRGALAVLPLIAWAFFLSVCERRHEALAEEPETIPDSSAHPTSNA